jgi:hypothetical protein
VPSSTGTSVAMPDAVMAARSGALGYHRAGTRAVDMDARAPVRTVDATTPERAIGLTIEGGSRRCGPCDRSV